MRGIGNTWNVVSRTGGRRSGTGRLALQLALAAALVGMLWVVLPASAGAAISYVAMGDSYTSGPGITPYAPGAPSECGQSELNYPHLVAAALKLSLTDVSCGGAKTENFTVAQYPDQPPQFDALSETTEVVSLGMGGNDNNLFGTLVQGCTEQGLFHPTEKAPCRKKYAAFVKESFEGDKAPFEAALREIHVLSPKAKVFVVGYPEITPAEGTCAGFEYWHEADLKWFRSVTKSGDANLKKEAKANGATFVDTFKESEGHNACQAVGTRWIEPLFGSLTGVAVHPNATGQEQDSYDVEAAMLKAGVR
jgi:GDSL-like Lipase/Acylhydrolase family